MAMELRTLHKIASDGMMEKASDGERFGTNYSVLVTVSLVMNFPYQFIVQCSLVSAVWSQEYKVT